MLPPLLASHMGGWGYGRQVYGLVWWIWYGLYACVKMLYYVVCATIALSWPDSAVNCFCAGTYTPQAIKTHVEAFVAQTALLHHYIVLTRYDGVE